MKNKMINFLSIFSLIFSFSCCQNSEVKKEVSGQALSQDIDVPTFKKLIAEGEGQLIDVRTADEFNKGHIEGSINVDFYHDDFKNMLIKELNLDKPVLVYCRSGGRSGKAMKLLVNDLGFKQPVYNLSGGYQAWSEK